MVFCPFFNCFKVAKVYFRGGMAERAELANGQWIMDN